MRKLKHYVKLLKQDPWRAYYAVKGFLLWYLLKRWIIRYLRYTIACKPCYDAGYCEHCECPSDHIFISNYKCKGYVDYENSYPR